MGTRILLVGRYKLLQSGLAHIIAEAPGAEVIGAVNNWGEAQALMTHTRPNVIIVDHESTELDEADLTPLLEAELQTNAAHPQLKVIYLTLADNKMIIHDRLEVTNVTPVDLLLALQIPEEKSEATL